MERYETEKLSKHQFASMKSWLELLHFMLFYTGHFDFESNFWE